MNTRILFLIITATVFLFIPSCTKDDNIAGTGAEVSSGSIHGTILDDDDNVYEEEVVVALYKVEDAVHVGLAKAITDSDLVATRKVSSGEYTFEEVDVGEYSISIFNDSIEIGSETGIVVEEDKTTNVTINVTIIINQIFNITIINQDITINQFIISRDQGFITDKGDGNYGITFAEGNVPTVKIEVEEDGEKDTLSVEVEKEGDDYAIKLTEVSEMLTIETGEAENDSITITNASLSSCPLTFDDTDVVYTIPSDLNITSNCEVTFGAHTKFIVKNRVRVEDGGTLTILEGAQLAFEEDAYISIGGNGNGTLKALGTEEDSIQFVNLTSGTYWGYAGSAASSGGLWFDDKATANCSLTYCSIDSASSGIYIADASVTISHCRITNNKWYGIRFYEGGTPTDSAGFIENIITNNGEYGISIYANFVGALSGTGSFTDNKNGGIRIVADVVETDAVWKKHDAPYVVDDKVTVGSGSGTTLTIRSGCAFELKEGAYFSIGTTSDEEGTLIANGTEEDSISFSNYSSGTVWGYAGSATSSGGLWFGDAATANCSLTYCSIDSASSGIYIADASVTISHCRITDNKWYGIRFYEGGTPTDSAGFIENIITNNGEYGVSIYANFVGALSGTGSFTGNKNGGILIIADVVETDAVWKKHDAPYVVDGKVTISGASGATLTIRPGTSLQLKDNAYIQVGEVEEGTLVAEGTESGSIMFSNYSSGTKWGYGSSATSSGGIWIDDMSTTNTSLKYCSITEAATGIYVSTSDPTIQNCAITENEYYGIYLYNSAGTNISDNTFADNGSGDIGTNR